MTTQDLFGSTTVANAHNATTVDLSGLTRVSLREIHEVAYRALIAHGASHGEARLAARMVLEAELSAGGGLVALIADLDREPWTHASVPVTESEPGGTWMLGSSSGNRMLRDGPLALELVAGAGAGMVGVPCDVADPGLLDPVALDLAWIGGTEVLFALVAGTAERGDAVVQIRRASPHGSIGVGLLEPPPQWCASTLNGTSGVLALSQLDREHEPPMTWVSAQHRADIRKRMAAEGLTVNASTWARAYGASRRYLVPD